jgi:hypothetical protein
MGNGSVNTFPLVGSRFLILQQLEYDNENGVSTWSVPRCYKQGTKSVVEISSWESVKRRPELVKLKNFHVRSFYQGKAGKDSAGWKRLGACCGHL